VRPLVYTLGCLEHQPGDKRSSAEQLGDDEHGEGETAGPLALVARCCVSWPR
jgi:hypothetical protein